jgi:hypothetical protein
MQATAHCTDLEDFLDQFYTQRQKETFSLSDEDKQDTFVGLCFHHCDLYGYLKSVKSLHYVEPGPFAVGIFNFLARGHL